MTAEGIPGPIVVNRHFVQYPAPQTAVAQVMADVEAGMEEILPVAARTALLDYKPGDIVIAPTGRGWHIVKVRGVLFPPGDEKAGGATAVRIVFMYVARVWVSLHV